MIDTGVVEEAKVHQSEAKSSSMSSHGLDFHLNSFDVEIDLTIDSRTIKADNRYASLCRQCWKKG